MSNQITNNKQEASIIKEDIDVADFDEVKKTKKRKILTEEHKEKNRANLERAREKLARNKAEKKTTVKEEIIKQQEDSEPEIDLETLLDKKMKKHQQKADKLKILENLNESNAKLLEKLQKMEDRVEKLYTLKKAKRRMADSPKHQQQPIIIQQPAYQPPPQYKSNNDRLREMLSKPINYL